MDFQSLLAHGDLRSIGKSNYVATLIKSQRQFDKLWELLFTTDRKVVMRAADAIEKITVSQHHFLQVHKRSLMELLSTAKHKELKWHLALLVSRLQLSKQELNSVWQVLKKWATNSKESRIVRVNALQGLFNLAKENKDRRQSLINIVKRIQDEHIPSIDARIKRLHDSLIGEVCHKNK